MMDICEMLDKQGYILVYNYRYDEWVLSPLNPLYNSRINYYEYLNSSLFQHRKHLELKPISELLCHNVHLYLSVVVGDQYNKNLDRFKVVVRR